MHTHTHIHTQYPRPLNVRERTAAAEPPGEVRAEEQQADQGGHETLPQRQEELHSRPHTCKSRTKVLRKREKVI